MMATARPPASRRASGDDSERGVVAIFMTDVEPAVRLNAALEAEGVSTVMISPMDDVRGELRRVRPEVLVLTGALLDPNNVALVRQQLWESVSVVGFTDVSDPTLAERLRDVGYAETWPKPLVVTKSCTPFGGVSIVSGSRTSRDSWANRRPFARRSCRWSRLRPSRAPCSWKGRAAAARSSSRARSTDSVLVARSRSLP